MLCNATQNQLLQPTNDGKRCLARIKLEQFPARTTYDPMLVPYYRPLIWDSGTVEEALEGYGALRTETLIPESISQ